MVPAPGLGRGGFGLGAAAGFDATGGCGLGALGDGVELGDFAGTGTSAGTGRAAVGVSRDAAGLPLWRCDRLCFCSAMVTVRSRSGTTSAWNSR
jgi:hypothetical protein